MLLLYFSATYADQQQFAYDPGRFVEHNLVHTTIERIHYGLWLPLGTWQQPFYTAP